MSRSIHETHRQLRDAKHQRYADPSKRRTVIREIRKQLRLKDRIKTQVEDERRSDTMPLQPSPTDLIPIGILETGAHIHYPAGVTDLRNVMRALPKGVLDGLTSIELRLEADPESRDGEPDPLVGRHGCETLPGVYSADVIGTCFFDGRITLSAYVYHSDLPNREVLELYLRLRMLSTFMHEVAHRFDWTARRSRGRWRMDDSKKNELYAEDFEHEWTQTIVVPYLERAYPHQVQALQAWVQFHGGAQIELVDLLEHGRSTSKAERKAFSSFFSGQQAFKHLLENVAGGLSRNETRIDYARALHYAELYSLALEALDGVLLESPNELEALVLKADIKVHQRAFIVARRLAEAALNKDATHLDALIVLSDALEGLHDWSALRSIALRTCNHDDLRAYQFRDALLHLAHANLELGNHAAVQENIIELDGLEAPRKRSFQCRKLAWLKTELAVRTRSKIKKVKS
jgi:hypothetical protein